MISLVKATDFKKTSGNVIRVDTAWDLFLPGSKGDLNADSIADVEMLKNWLWRQLGRKLGYLKRRDGTKVTVVLPEISKAGLEFIVRTCSFWSDEIYMEEKGNRKKNLWIAPVLNVFDIPGKSDSLSKLASWHHNAFHSLLSPILGSAKSNIRTYLIPSGMTFARFHSHTSREEFYLVLEGKGSARISDHKVSIQKGDLISKPTGPDLSTQLLADLGDDLRILDVEIWPDIDKRSKDLVHYPDHGELDLFGEGWNMMVPDEAIMSFEDSMGNYETGYVRHLDGSWDPKEIPGFPIRKKERKTKTK